MSPERTDDVESGDVAALQHGCGALRLAEAHPAAAGGAAREDVVHQPRVRHVTKLRRPRVRRRRREGPRQKRRACDTARDRATREAPHLRKRVAKRRVCDARA